MNRKSLRGLGIAVIVLPDPTFITDIVGLLLVGASFLFFRGKKPDSYKQLKGLVKSYLDYMKGGESRTCQPVHHTLRWNPEYSRTSRDVDSREDRQPGTATGQIIHHTLDRQRLLERYGIGGSINHESQRYAWQWEIKPEKVVHHRLDILQLSRRYQIGEYSQPVNQQKVMRHSLGTPALCLGRG